MFNSEVINAAYRHAQATAPKECCGLVIVKDNKQLYKECTNISSVIDEFIICPQDYAKYEDEGIIVGIVHSHYGTPPEPSQADLVGCERSKLPWLIINFPVGNYKIIEPTGYIAPLEGRQFLHGVFDCYSIIKDYYKQILNIDLPEFSRKQEWWLSGDNLYLDNFEKAGFVEVDVNNLEEHDGIIMQCRSPVPNHAAVYLGNNVILQHLTERLSGKDIYGGYWQKSTVKAVRYKGLIK